MVSPVKVFGFAGSLRKNSYNRGLLRAAQELLPEGMSLETYDLSPLPLYNADHEVPNPPEIVKDFQAHILAADALLIATPEYNYSLPGVLKNAIDWASRPIGPTNQLVLSEKPLGIMGASGGNYGTTRAQYDLRKVAVFTNMFPFNKPEVLVTRAREKFDAEGNLTDQDTRQIVRAYLEALAAWTRRLRGEKA